MRKQTWLTVAAVVVGILLAGFSGMNLLAEAQQKRQEQQRQAAYEQAAAECSKQYAGFLDLFDYADCIDAASERYAQ